MTGAAVRACAFGVFAASTLAPLTARADDPTGVTTPAPEVAVDAQVDLTRDQKTDPNALATADANAEAPPPAPYKKTLVLDSNIGVLGFLGGFHKISPWGPWFHTQLGYELLRWLMVFGEGEIAFTDTSNKVNQPQTRSFPIFGFGGGARATIHFTDRLGVYIQGAVGAMKADTGQNVLGLYGFRDAESLGLYLGARLGLEWYQVDRHFALGAAIGARTPQGFAQTGTASGTPAAIDTGVSLRYAF